MPVQLTMVGVAYHSGNPVFFPFLIHVPSFGDMFNQIIFKSCV